MILRALSHMLADLESVQGQLSDAEWSALGELSKSLSKKLEITREDVITLKNAVEEMKAGGQK